MLKTIRVVNTKINWFPIFIQKKLFLTEHYSCSDVWNSRLSSPILGKINLSDFYNRLDQNHSSKGVISPVDVDIFANAITDPSYLEELKDLLHRLRMSSETMNTLQSTHYATIMSFVEFGDTQELISILKDPLNYGIFLDNYTANILLNKLLTSDKYEEAANVASLIMLQEDYSNNITCSLCQYACYKYIRSPSTPPPTEAESNDEKPKKVEEIKIRIKFLRNPYFDDHFDIKDINLLSGKTLAWMSENQNDAISINLQVVGWVAYRKYDKALEVCQRLQSMESPSVSNEVIDFLKSEIVIADKECKELLEKCLFSLEQVPQTLNSLEESLKIKIENAINKTQPQDILQQKELLNEWIKIREEKLVEQTKRLDRAKRLQYIEERQKKMEEEEQKLWFFENEEKLDLEIEKKEKVENQTKKQKSVLQKDDVNYIPPEIIRKRR